MDVKWTRLAISDLDHAYSYIADEDARTAAKIIDQIEQSVRALARYPEIGRPGRVQDTRELVIAGTPFILPYRIRVNTIEILAVIHAARKWPEKL